MCSFDQYFVFYLLLGQNILLTIVHLTNIIHTHLTNCSLSAPATRKLHLTSTFFLNFIAYLLLILIGTSTTGTKISTGCYQNQYCLVPNQYRLIPKLVPIVIAKLVPMSDCNSKITESIVCKASEL
jgi:hypothetical protein